MCMVRGVQSRQEMGAAGGWVDNVSSSTNEAHLLEWAVGFHLVMHCPLALLPSLTLSVVGPPSPPSYGLLSGLHWKQMPKYGAVL